MKISSKREICPIRDILSRLGDKWSLLVLLTLNDHGTMRFSEINKIIEDISQRMLNVTLRSLETDGLINRTIYPEVPPRVEYCLSKSGKGLIPYLNDLVDWALENSQEIVKARKFQKSKDK